MDPLCVLRDTHKTESKSSVIHKIYQKKKRENAKWKGLFCEIYHPPFHMIFNNKLSCEKKTDLFIFYGGEHCNRTRNISLSKNKNKKTFSGLVILSFVIVPRSKTLEEILHFYCLSLFWMGERRRLRAYKFFKLPPWWKFMRCRNARKKKTTSKR